MHQPSSALCRRQRWMSWGLATAMGEQAVQLLRL
jgi:hypothetical protein